MAHTEWNFIRHTDQYMTKWTIFSDAAFHMENVRIQLGQHSSLTLGFRFCTFLWCVRWISHFGNRRTCFHWKCNVLRRHHWYIYKWDHEFKLNLPNFSLNLHRMSMEITEAGRRLMFSVHSWNQKTDIIMVLSFLVSPLLNLNYLTMILVLVWFTCNIHSVNLARLRSIKNSFHSEISLMEPDVSLRCVSHDQSSAVVKSDVPIPKTPFHPIPLRSVLLHLKMERDQTSLFCKASSPSAVVQIYYPHHLCSFETLAKAWKWQIHVNLCSRFKSPFQSLQGWI